MQKKVDKLAVSSFFSLNLHRLRINTEKMVFKYDFLIIGAGVAGMSYALKVARAHKGKVCMICKTSLDEANTSFAQGGVASVTNLAVDNFDKHIEDTMIAGDFISDRRAVEQVVRNAPEQIAELVKWGVNFDRKENGEFDLHREGGHSEFRILHHADDTGAEIQRGLMAAVRACPDIDVKENHFAVEIITQHHLGARVTRRTPYINCYGAYVLNPETQKVDTYLSKVTLMCTGGCGAVYQTTTNPIIATGDGEAMVYRAKGTVKDMEFVQFHPTALYHPGETHPAFLITEAMRGYGGILRLPNGESFMEKYDERLSLAPRDIVARAIDKEMKIHGLDTCFIDVLVALLIHLNRAKTDVCFFCKLRLCASVCGANTFQIGFHVIFAYSLINDINEFCNVCFVKRMIHLQQVVIRENPEDFAVFSARIPLIVSNSPTDPVFF